MANVRITDDIERVYLLRDHFLSSQTTLQTIRQEMSSLSQQINSLHATQLAGVSTTDTSFREQSVRTPRRQTAVHYSVKLTDIQQKVLLFCEKLEMYCAVKELSSVFLANKYVSDCTSILLSIKAAIEPTLVEQIYSTLSGEAKIMWEQLSERYRVKVVESVPWSEFLEFLELYADNHKDEFNDLMNPFGCAQYKEYNIDDNILGMLKWYMSSCTDRHVANLLPNSTLVQRIDVNSW